MSAKKPGVWKILKARVFNFPDDEVSSLKDWLLGKDNPTDAPAEATHDSGKAETASAWATAAAQAGPKQPAPAPAPAPLNPDDAPVWTAMDPVQRRTFFKRGTRIALVVIIAVLAWIGLREAIFGNNEETAQVDLPVEATFPTDQAAGTAELFVPAYLTWQEGKETNRAAAMQPYYSGGNSDGKLGWDGKGRQASTNATAVKVEPLSDTTARVTVVTKVTEYDQDNNTSTKPVAVEVKVEATESGTAVYGVPGIVGLPDPITVDPEQRQEIEDSNLTSSTKADAESFFTEYGSGTDLTSITAPGSTIQGLNGYLTNPTVKAWKVYEGAADRREATASVEWETSTGAKTTQTYTIELVQVSGGTDSRWQIHTLKGTE